MLSPLCIPAHGRTRQASPSALQQLQETTLRSPSGFSSSSPHNQRMRKSPVPSSLGFIPCHCQNQVTCPFLNQSLLPSLTGLGQSGPTPGAGAGFIPPNLYGREWRMVQSPKQSSKCLGVRSWGEILERPQQTSTTISMMCPRLLLYLA